MSKKLKSLREKGYLPLKEAAKELEMKPSTLYGYKKLKGNADYQAMFLQMRKKAPVWVKMSRAHGIMFKDLKARIKSAKARRDVSDT